jgi:hypothetical protein
MYELTTPDNLVTSITLNEKKSVWGWQHKVEYLSYNKIEMPIKDNGKEILSITT